VYLAIIAGVPLVSAAAVGLEGQLTVYCRAAAATAIEKAGRWSLTVSKPVLKAPMGSQPERSI
jgi:hypothetical protein